MFSDGLDFADDAVVATGDPGNEKARLQRDHRSSQQPKNLVNGITTRNEMLQIEKFADYLQHASLRKARELRTLMNIEIFSI